MNSPTNPVTEIVLAGHHEIVSPQHDLNFREFPTSSEGIVLVAMERYGQKKAADAAKAADNEPLLSERERARNELLEKARTNPETLREWLLHIIVGKRPEIMKNLNWATGTQAMSQYVIENGIYPILGESIVFDVPDSPIQQRIGAQQLSEMEQFILCNLEAYLFKMRDTITKFVDQVVLEGDTPNLLNLLTRNIGNLEQPHGKVKLKRAESWIHHAFIQLINVSPVLEAVERRPGTNTAAQDKITLQRLLHATHTANHPALFLFESQGVHLTEKRYESMDACLDCLLEELLPPLDKPDNNESAKNSIPAFEELEQLRAQLEVHMQRLATRGQVNKVLEGYLFPNRPITAFGRQYQSVPKKWRRGVTKRKLEDGLAQRLNPQVDEDVSSLLAMLDFCANAHARACLLKKNGANESQKKEADLLLEVVNVYADFLRQIGVELEAKMTIPNLQIPDLYNLTEAMVEFGAAGENLRTVVRQAMKDFQTARDSANEAEEAIK
jgi:hypothetical protein